jgi:DNA helicase-2/ATP-dependent DNA helicase PcrA
VNERTVNAETRGADAALAQLNAEQREAVDLYDRPVLVMAPVGTGKTNVLTLRAANAIRHGVPAESLLCLSFTNKAAREMKDRLFHFLGNRAAEISARTFHGLCALILRAESGALGLDGDFVIYDDEDCRDLFGQIWRRHGIEVPPDDADRFEFLLFEAAGRFRLSRYDEEKPRTAEEIFAALLADGYFKLLDRKQSFRFPEMVREYVALLRENHAVDFADLILGVNLLWEGHAEALARWQQKFRWIQVDEVQDTNRSEYRILAKLAAPHRNLSFFGDVDQTIYEWRGSAPLRILEEYRRDFAPVTEIGFVRNYRSTRNILEVCGALIRGNPSAATREMQPEVAEAGEKVVVHEAERPSSEAAWIAGRIRELHANHGVRYDQVAVLTRTNFTARDFSEAFERLGLPHVKVDQFKFFQRAEIKNALAHLRLVLNRHDGNSAMRYVEMPPKGIGAATIQELRGEPRRAGLKIADLLDLAALEAGDPFGPLLGALGADNVVVFDVETTGLDLTHDEIIEVAGARCGARGVVATFHALLRPSFPVGESYLIHGKSDEFLAATGRDPAEVLAEFREFRGDAVLAGHNILAFDVPILASQSYRLGFGEEMPGPAFDTLDLTRRFHRLQRYTLASIARELGLAAKPSHQAADDVAATAELLLRLLPGLEEGAGARTAAVAKHGAKFRPLAKKLAFWKERARLERPPELLGRILGESGLSEYYQQRPDGRRRVGHLQELVRLFERHDDPAMAPAESLVNLLNVASLGTDIDRYVEGEDCVFLLTAHQAKGLEFDTVFVAGATDDEFPSRRSKREGRVEEEQRLFYVAASRARKRLFFSYPAFSAFNRKTLPSRYLDMLPQSVVERE